MIFLTNEQNEKIALLDRLFGALSVEQLKEITETEQVVAILRGSKENPDILRKLISENATMSSDIMMLRGDVVTMRADLQVLAKLIMKPYDYNSASDAQALKSRLNIY